MKKIIAFIMVFTLLFMCFPNVYAETTANQYFSSELLNNIPNVEEAIKYNEYLEKYKDIKSGEQEIILKGIDYSSVKDMPDLTKDKDGIITQENGDISWKFKLADEGLYNIKIKYYPIEGKGGSIERAIIVNGELPYREANPVLLHRIWTDKDKNYKTQKGNQSFPSQIETPNWREIYLMDSEGFFNEPLKFHFNKGENELTLRSNKEPVKIEKITLTPLTASKTYEQYLDEWESKGAKWIQNADIKIQGEDAVQKSSPSFFPLNDRSSVMTEPYDPTYITLNTIGGKSWQAPRDWIKWEVDIPESGLYKIALRFKQSDLRGLFSTRCLKINEETPFLEASKLRFNYKTKFQVENLRDSQNGEFLFYFEKGKNTITLENSLGDFANLIYDVENITEVLNKLYSDVVVITGTVPDTFRDYQITKRLPNFIPDTKEQVIKLQEAVTQIQNLTGTNSDKTATLSKTIVQLQEIINNPDDIAKRLVSLKDNITALGKWSLDIKEQSLTIDYLIIGENNKLPKAEGNFIQNIGHEIKSFIGSFTNDFNVTSDNESTKETKKLEIWVTTGRDQLEVIRRLVNESFEAQTNTSVDLKLVNSDVLLPATFTGKGPDVAIQIASTLPINFAFRDAAYNLAEFDDFQDVYDRFSTGAMETFEFLDGYYALPDQMSFPVLFYRKDILSKNQIPVPETWDDIISVIPFLQKNNMDFYLDTAPPLTLGSATTVGNSKAVNPVYLSMFYQNGGELYNSDGSQCLLDSDIGLSTFTKWTDFYTKNSFPTVVDFVTRFRVGEVPLAVVDFTNYTKLSVSAPEIKGVWDMAPIPGTRQADGTIKRDLPCTTSACLIIKNSVQNHGTLNESWEFLKWWTSSDIQTKYAREMEAILGSSARYPVSNLESFSKAPWPKESMKVLESCLPYVREIRQVPGSYITGRYLDNAFYEVVNGIGSSSLNPSEVLYDYNVLINEEIHKKRVEFGLE